MTAKRPRLPCQCGPQSRVDSLGGLFLHPRHHVTLRVERDPDLGVAELGSAIAFICVVFAFSRGGRICNHRCNPPRRRRVVS